MPEKKESATPPAQEVDVEVLPPDSKEGQSPLMRFVAVLMDDLFLIPGTKVRVGLDPILGLFPGFGDTSANFISAISLIETAKRGMPRIVQARMALNILINAVIGCIPVLGDAFSVWFKSNKRNYELLKKHANTSTPRRSTTGDWVFVGVLVAILIGAILVVATVTFFIFIQLAILFRNFMGGTG